MTFVKNLYADLIDRRLWPLALVLVVALIAAPVVLSKNAKQKAVVPTAPSGQLGGTATSLLGETQPVVSLEGASSFRRHVAHLSRKNPFVQQALSKAQPIGQSATPPGATGAVPTTGTTPTTTTNTSPPPVTAPRVTPVRKFRFTAEVKFGELGKTSKKTLEPGDFLPNSDNPLVIFIAAADDGTTAEFLVSTEATAHGDGSCKPSASKCSVLKMKRGDVEFIEVANSDQSVTTYELDLVRVGTKEMKSSGAHKEHGLKHTHHRAALESTSRHKKARGAKKSRAKKSRAKKSREKKILDALNLFDL